MSADGHILGPSSSARAAFDSPQEDFLSEQEQIELNNCRQRASTGGVNGKATKK